LLLLLLLLRRLLQAPLLGQGLCGPALVRREFLLHLRHPSDRLATPRSQVHLATIFRERRCGGRRKEEIVRALLILQSARVSGIPNINPIIQHGLTFSMVRRVTFLHSSRCRTRSSLCFVPTEKTQRSKERTKNILDDGFSASYRPTSDGDVYNSFRRGPFSFPYQFLRQPVVLGGKGGFVFRLLRPPRLVDFVLVVVAVSASAAAAVVVVISGHRRRPAARRRRHCLVAGRRIASVLLLLLLVPAVLAVTAASSSGGGRGLVRPTPDRPRRSDGRRAHNDKRFLALFAAAR